MSQQAANQTQNEIVTLEATSCCQCGVAFAIPSGMMARLREKHAEFFCPNGHTLHFPGSSPAERLQKQLDFQRQLTDQARQERDRVTRSNQALRGVVKRTKNRVVAGVCPVQGCKRHFSDVQRHVSTKHPGFAAQDIG